MIIAVRIITFIGFHLNCENMNPIFVLYMPLQVGDGIDT